MIFLPILAALGASMGWAIGIIFAQGPAQQLGAFEFTRIQLIACSALLLIICGAFGLWSTVRWDFWPAYLVSSCVGVILGNLLMIGCLRQGGPRRTELLLSLKAPLVGGMAFVWLGELPSVIDIIGGCLTITGVVLAVGVTADPQSDDDLTPTRLMMVIGFGVLAALFHGIGFLVMKPAIVAGTSPLAVSAIRLLVAAFVISVVGLWPAAAFSSPVKLTPSLLGRTVLPGVIGYCIASSLLLYAMANFDAGIAVALGSLSPVGVILILWGKTRKPPKPAAALGAVLAVFGSCIIVLF